MTATAHLIEQAQSLSALSLREIARRAGTSHATLIAYRDGRKSPSINTLNRIIEACGLALDWRLNRRVRERRGYDRGAELVEVLRLAEQFPNKTKRRANYPIFPRTPAAYD